VPEKIIATYKIVTPMFIGDAEKNASDIRPSSVKGALRFWWRALNWGKFLEKEKGDEVKALAALHEQEGILFGGLPETIKDEKTQKNKDIGGQGIFLLKVISQQNYQTTDVWPIAKRASGYLGIGLWESGKQEKNNLQRHREAIEENQSFSIELLLKPTITSTQKKELEDVIKLWGLLGGLGSRVRRGFGSIALETFNNTQITFESIDDYLKAIHLLLNDYAVTNKQPPFTAFSKKSQLGTSASKTNARAAHAELGELFRNYRGQPSPLRGSKKRVFGMPYTGGTKKEEEARRASPLLFHIHPIANKYKGIVLSMPAVFHYEEDLKNVDESLISNFFIHLHEVLL
jgi:CRISPR-associated protein Cmr1